MQDALATAARLLSESYRQRKFRDRGARLNVADVLAYDESAREVIRVGRRVVYRDLASDDQRVGYFNARRNRFTALSADETMIVNHFRATANYVRRLPDAEFQ